MDSSSLTTIIIMWIVVILISVLFIKSRQKKKSFNSESCCICENKTSNIDIADGRICKECLRKYKDMPNFLLRTAKTTKSELLSYAREEEANIKLNNSFNVTKKIGTYIEFDQERRQFRLIPTLGTAKKVSKVYNCDEIIEFELLEDGISVTSGGLGRAAVGGVLLGGVGAIVGGVTGKKKTKSVIENFKIKLTLNDFNNPTVYIELLNKKKIKTNSNKYKEMYEKAQEILSTLAVLQKNKAKSIPVKEKQSATDRIREYKALFDDGIITEDEFNVKKKELLEI